MNRTVSRTFLLVSAILAVILLAACPNNLFFGLEAKPLDTEGPEITVINPSEGQSVSGVMIVIGTANDKYRVSRMTLQVGAASPVTMDGTNTWNYVLDTSTYPEGPLALTIRGEDNFGNETEVVRTIVVDQDVPSVTVDLDLATYENYLRGGSALIYGTAADNIAVTAVQLSFNGGLTWIDADTLAANDDPGTVDRLEYDWTISLDTGAAPFSGDGFYTPQIRVRDDAGLIGSTATLIFVDNTPPAIASILSPVADTTIDASAQLDNNYLVVRGTVTDNVMAASVHLKEVRVTVGSLPTVSQIAGDLGIANPVSFSRSIDITSIRNDGSVPVTIVAADKAGNETTSTFYIVLDDDPPSFVGGLARDELSGATHDGSLDNDLAARRNYFGTGTADNVISGQVTPVLGIASIHLRLVNGSGTDVLGNVLADNNNLDPLDDGKPDGGGLWSHRLNVSAVANGTYTLKVRVTNSLGGFADIQRTVVVDRTDPAVSITTPIDGQLVTGNAVSVSGYADATGSPVYSVRIRINDGTTDTTVYETELTAVTPGFAGLASMSGGYFTYIWNTDAPHAYPIGTHSLEVTAIDMAGNTGSDATAPVKDPDSPSVSVSLYSHPTNALYADQPLTNGRWINGSGTIKGSAADAEGLASVEISTNGGITFFPATTTVPDISGNPAALSWTYTLPGLAAGARTIYIRVTDADTVGGAAQSTYYMTVNVDNTDPSVDPLDLDLADGSGTSYYHGLVNVNGSASDAVSGLASVSLSIAEASGDGPESLTVSGTTTFSATWDTEALPTNGGNAVLAGDDMTLTARATDSAGNFNEQTSTGLNVRPYISSLSAGQAYLGQTGLIVNGHNFTNTSPVTIGGGTVSVTGRNLAVNPNTITFTIPAGYPPADPLLSSGAALVTSNGLTNAAQTPVKLDLFHIESLVAADAPLYPALAFDGASARFSYAASQGTNRYLRYRAPSTERTLIANTGGNRPAFTALGYHASAQFVTYSMAGTIYIARSTDNFATGIPLAFPWPKTISAGGGLYSDVRVSPADPALVHVVYHEGGQVKYLRSTDGFANIPAPVTLDASGTAGTWIRLALGPAPNHNPHVVYHDSALGALRYTRYTGSAWLAPITVDSSNAGNFGNGLAVGGDGSVHISFYDGNSGDLVYAYAAANPASAASFTKTTVDSPGISGWFSSLAVDSAYSPHIGYLDFTNTKPKYARKVGGAWKTMTIPETGIFTLNSNSNYTATAVDSAGTGDAHVVYPAGNLLQRSIYLVED